MSRSRLSIHAIPVHDPDKIINFAKQIQPPVILIVDPDVNFISRAYQASPGSRFSLRNHPLSEQKSDVYNDPAGTGDRHAREMVEWCDKFYAQARERNLPMPPLSQVILPGMNEPLVNTDDEISDVVTYNVHYLDGLTQRGRIGSALEFSVGWPRNGGNGLPPQWEAWRPVYEAIKRGKHVASIHEYWPNEGPSYWAGWLCYRLVMWIPDYWHDVDFIMTECGLDDAAVPGRVHKFWKDFFLQNPAAYVTQYHEYEWNCRSLKNRNGVAINIIGYCVFTLDYGGNEWEGADIRPITELFAHFVATANMPDSGSTIHLPVVGNEPTPVEPGPTVPISPKPQANVMEWTIDSLCRVFGYDPDLARAILRVESGKRPFQGGKPVIRNEAHIQRHYIQNKDWWNQHFRVSPTKAWEDQHWRRSPGDPWKAIHTSQESEWEVFEFVRAQDSHAAHMGLGMGAAQIMGFNYTIPEYASPQAMLHAFSDETWGPSNQVLAMFAYFYKIEGMVEAIRNRDLPTIALKYNGSGQVNYYVQRFKEELDAIAREKN